MELTPQDAFILRSALLVWNNLAPCLSPTPEGEQQEFFDWLFEVCSNLENELLILSKELIGENGERAGDLPENQQLMICYLYHNINRAEFMRNANDTGIPQLLADIVRSTEVAPHTAN